MLHRCQIVFIQVVSFSSLLFLSFSISFYYLFLVYSWFRVDFLLPEEGLFLLLVCIVCLHWLSFFLPSWLLQSRPWGLTKVCYIFSEEQNENLTLCQELCLFRKQGVQHCSAVMMWWAPTAAPRTHGPNINMLDVSLADWGEVYTEYCIFIKL